MLSWQIGKLPRQERYEGRARQEVWLLVARRRMMVVLPENQVSARWKGLVA
jgi:hypothetical protein